MSKIKFCALGGLGENGKNLYVVTVDEDILLLDAGLKFPSIELYGIDAVIPDISYLEQNKEKIIGLFLSHGHDEYVGAIAQILRNFSIPVYGSDFTISIVNHILEEESLNPDDFDINRINDDMVLEFNNIKVTFFNITHSIPECMGIVIHTVDGAICYVPDFSLTFTSNIKYQTSFDKLTHIGKQRVLLLAAESLGVNNINRLDNDYSFNHIVSEALQSSGRTIFTLFSHDLNRIQKTVDLIVASGRKVAILGRKVQKTINVAMSEDYLRCDQESLVNLKFIDEQNNNNDDNLAIIITGIRHEPFFMLQRMMNKVDKLIHIYDTDTIIILSPPVLGTEKIATRTIDRLNREGAKVINVSRSVMKSSHADGEDLKMLYQMIKPEYVVPVIGEYRHQYVHKSIALEAGFDEDHVLVLENGEEITFTNGVLEKYRDKIPTADVLIDGSLVGDINEVVLRDREMLSQDGTAIIVLNIDSSSHKVISGPKIVTRGFITDNALKAFNDEIIEAALEVINIQLGFKQIDWNLLKQEMKETITRIIKSKTKKNPIVIPVIIDTNGEDL